MMPTDPREGLVTERREGENGTKPGMRQAAATESRATGASEPSAAERRARALRENLRRRKAQVRARDAVRSGESPPED